jgi:hypothetical protein
VQPVGKDDLLNKLFYSESAVVKDLSAASARGYKVKKKAFSPEVRLIACQRFQSKPSVKKCDC